MKSDDVVIPPVPQAADVRLQVGRLLRDLHVARRLLKLAELAERYRSIDNATTPVPKRSGVQHAG